MSIKTRLGVALYVLGSLVIHVVVLLALVAVVVTMVMPLIEAITPTDSAWHTTVGLIGGSIIGLLYAIWIEDRVQKVIREVALRSWLSS